MPKYCHKKPQNRRLLVLIVVVIILILIAATILFIISKSTVEDVVLDTRKADIIIIGAGTAGCIVAKRLSERFPKLCIIVLERGTNRR